jgi:aryl-alcohol dehydrogenase-like predicted oxidoreductase
VSFDVTAGLARRTLGRTALSVSALGLGTVELGMDYGIPVSGDFGRPPPDTAVALLQLAAGGGIDFFDTAPGYGAAEELLGQALATRAECAFATKVTVPRDASGARLRGAELRREVDASLAESRRRLRREILDLVQVHNATLEVLGEGELAQALVDARDRDELRFIGASVYTEAEALAAIDAGCFDVLQVPYNLLDRRMAGRAFPAARRAGVGIIVRSAFLKGALTPKARSLPANLAPLAEAADRVRQSLDVSWEQLPSAALRFCLASPDVATVIVGVRNADELTKAVAAAVEGPLPAAAVRETEAFARTDERLVDPSKWVSL